MQRLCRCTNSIGSSIVMMWSVRVRLISSIIAASVVDLPEPVGPVTTTRPRGKRRQLGERSREARAPRASSARAARRGRRRRAGSRSMKTLSAEARDAGDRVGEVDLAIELEPLLLLGRENPVEQRPERVGVELRRVGQELDRAPHANRRLGADREVEVRRTAFDRLLEPASQSSESVSLHEPGYRQRSARTLLTCRQGSEHPPPRMEDPSNGATAFLDPPSDTAPRVTPTRFHPTRYDEENL